MHFKLTEEILKLSDSNNWEQAKIEWTFEYAYCSEELQSCLCGHYPIKNICVLKNSKNTNTTEVGNCCVNKFLGIDDGNKIFTSIKRLKEDLSKSMSPEVLEFLHSKKVLSEYEYGFYLDTIRKRSLSHKQKEIRKRINQKFLDFTSGEVKSQFSRINLVLKWAEENTWFDATFVNSLNESCKRKGKLTEPQKSSLERIISKCKIE
jgi:hypothetical protein